MGEVQLVKHIREENILRESFFELANTTFGLDFRNWYEQGYWNNRYIPYSFQHGNKIIANVSVNLLDFIIDGMKHRAIQIGTVMTHPDFRHQGLSKELMNRVLSDYKDQYDFMYLFANQTVLDFYPKFGFEKVEEVQYTVEVSFVGQPKNNLQKLDSRKNKDSEFIYHFAEQRAPVSQRFSTINSLHLFMYHCLNTFRDNLYYHPTEDAIVLYEQTNNQIHLFDIVSRKKPNYNKILAAIAGEGRHEVIFHFTPDDLQFDYKRNLYEDGGTLFVRTNGIHTFPSRVKHSVTSEA